MPEYGALLVQLAGQLVEQTSITVDRFTIGRVPGNDLVLQHPLISRAHVEIRHAPEGVTITDLGSSNGTYVGGERLLPSQPRFLADGSVFEIGPYRIGYRDAGASRKDTTGLEPEPQPVEEPAQAPEPPPAEVAAPARESHPPAPAEPLPVLPSAEAALRGGGPPVPPPPAPSRGLPALPTPLPTSNDASRYLPYLPAPYQENDFLRRFLLIFEAVWEPLEWRADHIDAYFDAGTAPESMLSWLAGWFGLTLNARWPEERRRKVLREAIDLYRWRGTTFGLTKMIEICTGRTPDIIDLADRPYVIRVRVPGMPDSGPERDLVEQLIVSHKPAHVGYVLEGVS